MQHPHILFAVSMAEHVKRYRHDASNKLDAMSESVATAAINAYAEIHRGDVPGLYRSMLREFESALVQDVAA